ncbi:spore coat protein [Candidatus Contubernalis alkaliaceticus]|uniref:spore coat protein n=1 Tax=Candidatus Contubernalis alkaliaceticus TaxID=338645 RepID=UPI001F4C32A1|nr:spore coat protein [Candidatus Contubernalis alkalaceticus]UNC92452.1 spore coat protein [Candidatus Contubernalis alkalaceticus]
MTVQLTQKEKLLLQDQKTHEEICIQKYKSYANQASDPQLKQLFNSYAQQEQQHLDTVNQMLKGQVPDVNQQQNQIEGQQQNQPQEHQIDPTMNKSDRQKDAALCNDLLMTEKYVSDTYNTAIFEFQDTKMRQALNHIQKEEQQHGEGISNYMINNGMYDPQ